MKRYRLLKDLVPAGTVFTCHLVRGERYYRVVVRTSPEWSAVISLPADFVEQNPEYFEVKTDEA